jgi:hypothetical protein
MLTITITLLGTNIHIFIDKDTESDGIAHFRGKIKRLMSDKNLTTLLRKEKVKWLSKTI